MKKKERGYAMECVSKDGVVVTKWYDNKPVVLASNFVGIGEQDVCRRWDKQKKEFIVISRPEIIKTYNNSMGGVDKHDLFLSIDRSYVRSRKWTIRLITHAVDLALVNAWLEYKNEAIELGIPKQKILDLLALRLSVGEHFVYTRRSPRRGRPSDIDVVELSKRQKYESRHDVTTIE